MKPAVLFILSATYCDPELQAEFGRTPACCVPIGPKRLVDLQVEEAWDKIDNLQHVFVALPIEKHGEARLVQGGSLWNVHMETTSMDETFQSLMGAFRTWLKIRKAQGAIFDDDEWAVHVLNGDTLIKVEKETANLLGTFNVQKNEDTQPYVMSKEFDKHDDNSEYAGRLAFLYMHSVNAAWNYTDLVRNALKLRIHTACWLDFGHLQTYYRSKRNLLSARAFNKVMLDDTGHIRKSGPADKIAAEKEWYRVLPPYTAMYAPRVVITRESDYLMEYLPMPTLSELLVHGRQGGDFWRHIANKLDTLLHTMREEAPVGIEFQDGLFLAKSKFRVIQLSEKYQSPALEIYSWLSNQKLPHNSAVLHGDLCFSNILYDRRSDTLKIIDPRGIPNDGEVYGNQLYDVAKLYHSTEGGYDFAVAGVAMRSEEANEACKILSGVILEYAKEVLEIEESTLTAVTALLFFSMLPLHREDEARVSRLAHAGQRLYNMWKRLGQ